jgi:hypothetical protein
LFIYNSSIIALAEEFKLIVTSEDTLNKTKSVRVELESNQNEIDPAKILEIEGFIETVLKEININ